MKLQMLEYLKNFGPTPPIFFKLNPTIKNKPNENSTPLMFRSRPNQENHTTIQSLYTY